MRKINAADSLLPMDFGFYSVDSAGRHRTWSVWLLAGLIFICFWLQWLLPPPVYHQLLLARHATMPWSLVSHAFLHGHSLHLLWNLLLLVTFGTIVCRRLGAIAFLSMCIVAVPVTGIAHLRFDGDPAQGCSGMTYMLMGLAPFCDSRAKVGLMERQIWVPAWILAAVLSLKNVFLIPFFEMKVSHAGHFTGLAMGLCAGLLLLLWQRLIEPSEQPLTPR